MQNLTPRGGKLFWDRWKKNIKLFTIVNEFEILPCNLLRQTEKGEMRKRGTWQGGREAGLSSSVVTTPAPTGRKTTLTSRWNVSNGHGRDFARTPVGHPTALLLARNTTFCGRTSLNVNRFPATWSVPFLVSSLASYWPEHPFVMNRAFPCSPKGTTMSCRTAPCTLPD